MKIIYCDNQIIVAIKPAGTSTQPHFENEVRAWVKEQFKKKGEAFLHAVHRLDRQVEGLVLFARTSKSLSRLNQQMREGKIKRLYLAEVEGVLSDDEATLEHYLVHGSHKAMISNPNDKRAKYASLTYKVIEKSNYTTKVIVDLKTGRYHQIRAQFSAIGHPIVGDELYGAKKANIIRLSCQKLIFIHPVTKKEIICCIGE